MTILLSKHEKFPPQKVLSCMVDYVYYDQGEITRLVCTKYTHLYCSIFVQATGTSLIYCVEYSIASYTSNKYFIAKLCLSNKLLNLKF